MQLSLPQALLVLVFRAAHHSRPLDLPTFSRRSGASPGIIARALEGLEGRGFLTLHRGAPRLTLGGLALAASLSARVSRQARPLARCRPLAA